MIIVIRGISRRNPGENTSDNCNHQKIIFSFSIFLKNQQIFVNIKFSTTNKISINLLYIDSSKYGVRFNLLIFILSFFISFYLSRPRHFFLRSRFAGNMYLVLFPGWLKRARDFFLSSFSVPASPLRETSFPLLRVMRAGSSGKFVIRDSYNPASS